MPASRDLREAGTAVFFAPGLLLLPISPSRVSPSVTHVEHDGCGAAFIGSIAYRKGEAVRALEVGARRVGNCACCCIQRAQSSVRWLGGDGKSQLQSRVVRVCAGKRYYALVVLCATATGSEHLPGTPAAILWVTFADTLVLVPLFTVKVKLSAPWKLALGV